jgi:hypothetical protein
MQGREGVKKSSKIELSNLWITRIIGKKYIRQQVLPITTT